MSTPNQPNEEVRRSGADVTPRGQQAPDAGRGPQTPARPAAPRPVGQPAVATEPSADEVVQPQTEAMPKLGGPGQPKRPDQPPWQREPQTNLNRPGQAPAIGRPTAGDNGTPSGAGRPPSPVERAAQKQVNRTKAAVIDGPTRNLARPNLDKDMPDLSGARHPSPVDMDNTRRETTRGAAAVAAAAAPDPLRATVQLRRIDPWTTLQVSLVISAALFLVWMVAVGLLYGVLDGMGVWERLNNAFTDIVSDGSSAGLVSAGQVFGYAAVIGLVNAVLLTALATIGSFIYNQCSDLVGGIQVTLADPD